ncbi:hypothetical protein ACMS8A_004241 [Escherichia coli O28ac,42:H7]|nr:hypothetical protein [Escherichia coli]
MSQIPAPCSGQFPDTLRHQHDKPEEQFFVSGIHKERNIQVCATLNGIVKIIKAQNLSFFFVKKIIFVKFYDIAEEFASLRCRFSFAWFS